MDEAYPTTLILAKGEDICIAETGSNFFVIGKCKLMDGSLGRASLFFSRFVEYIDKGLYK